MPGKGDKKEKLADRERRAQLTDIKNFNVPYKKTKCSELYLTCESLLSWAFDICNNKWENNCL